MKQNEIDDSLISAGGFSIELPKGYTLNTSTSKGRAYHKTDGSAILIIRDLYERSQKDRILRNPLGFQTLIERALDDQLKIFTKGKDLSFATRIIDKI